METACARKMTGNKERIEQEFGIDFKGPGFYLSNTDTLLIIPLNTYIEKTWHQTQPEDTQYYVEVWNTDFYNTIYAVIATAPVRVDDRD